MPYVVPQRKGPSRRRRSTTADLLPAAGRERRIAELISESLELLEQEQLVSAQPRNPDDDDGSTRRLGTRQKRK